MWTKSLQVMIFNLEGFLHGGMHLRGVSQYVANLPPTWPCAFEETC